MKKSETVHQKSGDERTEYSVSGPLAWIFRLSQLFAVTPVTFRKQRDERIVSVSRRRHFVYCLFMTCMNVMCFAGILVDLSAKQGLSNYGFVVRFLWVAEDLLAMMIASAAVYGASSRLERVFTCLSKIQKIKREIGGEETKSHLRQERQRSVLSILLFVLAAVIKFAHYAGLHKLRLRALEYRYSMTISTLYIAGVVADLMALLILLEFALVAIEVNSALTVLNDAFERLGSAGLKATSPYPKETLQETIRRLAYTLATVCGVVKQVGEGYGLVLVMLLVDGWIVFLKTPFNLAVSFAMPKLPVMKMSLEIGHCVLHFICLLLFIEPPNRTLVQVERTQELMKKLMLQSSNRLVKKELGKLSKYFQLNRIEYSPLGICSLRRGLLVTIFGSISAYLVIVIKFQNVG